jgi:hypothetical protein
LQYATEKNALSAVEMLQTFRNDKLPERVTFVSNIGNRIREDVYDFTMRERVTMMRNGRFGAVEALTITGFSAIEDRSDTSKLRQAFNEHVKRGGKTEEADIFPTIFKPKPGSIKL